MKFISFGIAVFLILLVISFFLTKRIFRYSKKGFVKRLIVFTLIQVFLTTVTILVLMIPYYKAGETAHQFLHSDEKTEFIDNKKYYAFLNDSSRTAVIFYPGSSVDEYAYSYLASSIAADGVDVYVIKSPLHFPLLNGKGAANIFQKTNYEKIFIGGHSLGGYVASRYASDSHSEIDGLFLLGAYPFGKIDERIRFISIYGSEDGILDRKEYEARRQYWPKDSEEQVIDGGNHSYFADYGLQRLDHEALIDRKTQMELTHKLISEFIWSPTHGSLTMQTTE